MKFHKLRLDLSRHHFYWAGGIAALVAVCVIAAMVVQASEAATLSDSAGLQSSRLHDRASGSGDSLDETPDPGLSPVPSPASPANPTATAGAPIAVRSPAASTPAVKTPTVPKFAPVVENPADPYSRYNLVQGPDGKPQPGSGPDVRCDFWNNTPPLPVGRGQTLNIGCTVISHNGFSAPSTLTCGQPGNSAGMSTDVVPGPIPCSFNPSVVTPPPDGVARSTLTIQIPLDLPYGWYDIGFKVDSPGASLFMPPVKPINLDVPRPDFSADCGTRQMMVTIGQGWTDLVCTVTVPPAFDDWIKIFQGNMGGPDGVGLELRSDVDRLDFPPEGGTKQVIFSAKSEGGYTGTHRRSIDMSNADTRSVHGKQIFIDIELRRAEG